MSNSTWVCFDCRESVRRPTEYPGDVPCPQCGRACRCLGTRIRIPSRDDARAWYDLRVVIRDQRLAELEHSEPSRVRDRHHLERQIADIESRPSNEDRDRTLRQLRARLASS